MQDSGGSNGRLLRGGGYDCPALFPVWWQRDQQAGPGAGHHAGALHIPQCYVCISSVYCTLLALHAGALHIPQCYVCISSILCMLLILHESALHSSHSVCISSIYCMLFVLHAGALYNCHSVCPPGPCIACCSFYMQVHCISLTVCVHQFQTLHDSHTTCFSYMYCMSLILCASVLCIACLQYCTHCSHTMCFSFMYGMFFTICAFLSYIAYFSYYMLQLQVLHVCVRNSHTAEAMYYHDLQHNACCCVCPSSNGNGMVMQVVMVISSGNGNNNDGHVLILMLVSTLLLFPLTSQTVCRRCLERVPGSASGIFAELRPPISSWCTAEPCTASVPSLHV